MLSNQVYWTESEVKEHLLQMFPTSADVKVDEVKSFTESYHKYKREFVKHVGFNPEEDNLSKCISDKSSSFASSFSAGACPATSTQQLMMRLGTVCWRGGGQKKFLF